MARYRRRRPGMRCRNVSGTVVILAICVFAVPVHPSDRLVLFRNVDVFDGSRMLRRASVLVRDGMIRSVGPETAVPPAAEVVDGAGKTLLPGLFDAHTHLGIVNTRPFLADALRFGVTTEIEMGGTAASLALRKTAAEGPADGADFRTAGIPITV